MKLYTIRGVKREKNSEKRKGDILLALQRRRVFTGKHNVWENTLKKIIISERWDTRYKYFGSK